MICPIGVVIVMAMERSIRRYTSRLFRPQGASPVGFNTRLIHQPDWFIIGSSSTTRQPPKTNSCQLDAEPLAMDPAEVDVGNVVTFPPQARTESSCRKGTPGDCLGIHVILIYVEMVGQSGTVTPLDEWGRDGERVQMPRIRHKRRRGATIGANLPAHMLGWGQRHMV